VTIAPQTTDYAVRIRQGGILEMGTAAGNHLVMAGGIYGGNLGRLDKTGAGTLHIAADSTVTATYVRAGEFHVLDGITHAGNTLTVYSRGTLSGGGTVANWKVLIYGVIDPDNYGLPSSVPVAGDQYNTLTIAGTGVGSEADLSNFTTVHDYFYP
jgi:hypothetical protein